MSRGATLKSAADLSLIGFQLPAARRLAVHGFGKPSVSPGHDTRKPCSRARQSIACAIRVGRISE
jgi:hypothetical protein